MPRRVSSKTMDRALFLRHVSTSAIVGAFTAISLVEPLTYRAISGYVGFIEELIAVIAVL